MERVKRFKIVSGATKSLRDIVDYADAPYTLLFTRPCELRWVDLGLERMLQIAEDTGAAMVYADHFNGVEPAPVIDCQPGSLRDDFDFGGALLYRTECFRKAVESMDVDYRYAALYDLRLRVSEMGRLVHIPEFLYYETDADNRDSDVKQFDYVNPRNREVQIEMEAACTAHLKRIGAWLAPVFKDVDLSEGDFPVEASVVIPCKNRVQTIGDAIRSALNQKTDFAYNVIVVDDNSDDGSVQVIKSFSSDPRLVYIAQDSSWHAIGGNWNAAIHHPACGRFALQLDSDDVYSGPDTVRKFVEAFRQQNCAMVVGSYRITDFELNTLPPGWIDHREWTEDNGRNNALRVNGLGAPRGFFVPLLRRINFPVTKYGEDYAVGLRISREYRIGRIYEELYCCRNNYYKDRLRTWELQARLALNADSGK